MLLCVNTVHEGGYYDQLKRVGEVIIYMLTARCAISWKEIYSYIIELLHSFNFIILLLITWI
jgi:hypothetical protein